MSKWFSDYKAPKEHPEIKEEGTASNDPNDYETYKDWDINKEQVKTSPEEIKKHQKLNEKVKKEYKEKVMKEID